MKITREQRRFVVALAVLCGAVVLAVTGTVEGAEALGILVAVALSYGAYRRAR